MNSRRTVILTADGNPLVALNAQNITDDGNGVITIEVDSLETPVTIGTGNVKLRDNSSVLEATLNGGSNWDIVTIGGDDDAIHDNVTAEISAVTEKVSPVGADVLLIEDSAASNAKKRVQITNLPGGADSDAIHDNVTGEIVAVTEKVSPVGADVLLIEDSTASNAKKRVQITNLPGGADSDAIHDNVSAEISAITEKASPVSTDVLIIEDSEASNAKKRVQITNLPGGADSDAIHDNVSAEISAITEKASPISADILLIEDSEASNAKKKVQITNLPGGADSDAIHDNVSAEILAVTEKGTPIGADLILIEDSADSNNKKRIQITNLPADADTLHDNVSAEIVAITEKLSPVSADILLIEDSESSNAKKRVQIANLPGGADSDAIHDNVSAEIVAVTEKGSPVGADVLIIEDSEASNAKKRVQITNLPGGSDSEAIHDNVSAEIVAVTEKASPVGADVLLIEDSEASNAKKRVHITNLPGGADSDAIHDNVAGEITAIAEKASPIDADKLLIEDIGASNSKKRIQLGNIPFISDSKLGAVSGVAQLDGGGKVPEAQLPSSALAGNEFDGLLDNRLALQQQTSAPSAVASYGHIYTTGTGDPIDAKTKLLIHSNTTNGSEVFTDSGTDGHTVTGSGTIQHSTTQKKFGTTAIFFNGTTQFLTLPDHSDFDFTDVDFTIDCWVYFDGTIADQVLFDKSFETSQQILLYINSTTNIQLYYSENGSSSSTINWTVSTLAVSTWYHIALERYGDTIQLYIDGTGVNSQAFTAVIYNGATTFHIGCQNNTVGDSAESFFDGYMDEFRISKGIARYQGNFTPETAAYGDGLVNDVKFKDGSGTEVSLVGKTTTTITGTTYQPTALQCADLTIFCKTGANTIELTDPATGNPGSVKVYALDTQTLTVTATTINELGSTGTQYQNNDTAYEWAWFIFEHTASQWIVFQENGTWNLTTP